MNNDAVNGSFDKILETVKERFQKSQHVQFVETVFEVQKFSWGTQDTAKVMDTIINMREKMHKGRQTGGTAIAKECDDKFWQVLFIETGKKEGRIDKVESTEIEKEIEKEKYDLEKFKSIVRKVKIEKEVPTNFNETAFVDRGRTRTNSFNKKRQFYNNSQNRGRQYSKTRYD